MGLSRLALVAFAAYLTVTPTCFSDPLVVSSEMPTLAPFLERISPAVVNITATGSFPEASPMDESLTDFVFDLPIIAPQLRSAGSGVIIDAKSGLIVTNSHLVNGAERIVVTLKDKRTYDAVPVGVDPGIDIALLRISAKGLTDLPLGKSDKLRVGDYIVAIGNPFGLGQTVSTGIVSAIGLTQLGIEEYEDFIQTDAAINPGDSGGALVNLRGELVGINTAIVSVAGGNVGIAFAIPVDLARISIDRLLKDGEVRRGWLGLRIQDLTPSIAAAMGVSVTEGALVNEVFAGAPAVKADIRAGDVIVSINSRPVRSAGQLRNEVGMIPLGDVVQVTVLRDGSRAKYSLRVEEPVPEPEAPGTEGDGWLADARFEVGHGASREVKIVDMRETSPLAWAGLLVGDVIVTVNRQPIATVETLFKAITGPGPFALRIRREDSELLVVLR